ncbi:hypothetical protein OTU49_001351, partial [Cherax quadricarinatus]
LLVVLLPLLLSCTTVYSLEGVARMVCIPCIVVPVLLFIWHRFLQPVFLTFWNPWRKVTAGTEKKGEEKEAPNGCTASNGAAVANGDLMCPFSGKETGSSEAVIEDKKND